MVLLLGAGINLGDKIDLGDGKNIDLSWSGLLNGLFAEAFSLLSIGKGYTSDECGQLQSLICNIGEKSFDNDKSKENWNLLRSYASSEFPHLVQASIIKSVLGKNYINSIRKHLYQQCDKNMMKKLFLKYYGLNSVAPKSEKIRIVKE